MQRRLWTVEPGPEHRHRLPSLARLLGPPANDARARAQRAILGLGMALSVSLVVAAVLSAYELLVLEIEPWAEGPPEWSAYYAARLVLALGCSCLLLLGVECGAVAGTARAESVGLCATEQLTVVVLCGVALIFTAIFLHDPQAFSVLGSEDHVIEWLSAAALGAAAACFAYMFLRARRTGQRAQLITAGLFTAAFLFIALEEVSWFQRVFGFDTPWFLAANQQEELNLHNLHSNLSELLYYGGAFVVLILLPYTCVITGGNLVPGLPPAALGSFLIGASAPLAGYNYDMWNIFPIQITFFVTCLILARLVALAALASRLDAAAVLGLSLITVVITQVVFLWTGAAFVRLWDVTEYKEFFIAAGCLCLALTAVREPPES